MKVRGVFLVCAVLALGGCARPLRDGVYTGRSSGDDAGAFGEITITVAGGRVTACEFVTWQKDGSAKGADYGKVNGAVSNRDYYEKAQLAVRAMESYARQYGATGKLDSVDAITGATISWNQFMEAAGQALEKAK
ncbi:MAG: FMN-binding protein [Spirochaetaceae bacterium]|jgi:major membrane immunogen (membrane-anchored lipoprotein)|nr:FMN-binding protein [Spirochaetaceae bacterium]